MLAPAAVVTLAQLDQAAALLEGLFVRVLGLSAGRGEGLAEVVLLLTAAGAQALEIGQPALGRRPGRVRDGHLGANVVIARNAHYDAPVFGDQTEQRDAVLTNFASH